MIAPGFHHYAPGQWINDPVGLHRWGDRWVLHDQRADRAGDTAIGWGRATSCDLLDWRDEGLVLPPEADTWIYSGSVVADASPPQAFFTLHNRSTGLQAQGAAEWRGQWVRAAEDRVSARACTRDPFVFRWGSEWRMVLAQPPPWDSPYDRPSRLLLLRSTDLITWEELGPFGPSSALGEMFETPLLRQVPVAGEAPVEWPWLLAVGVIDRSKGAVCGTRAWFGHFDGREFVPEGSALALDHGPDFYAPAVWSGTPQHEVIVTGWTNSWAYAKRLPEGGWSGGAHALPRRLTAERRDDSFLLRQRPAAFPATGQSQVITAGSHAVTERFVLGFHGTGTARLGDLTLTLREDHVAIERTAPETLGDCTFAGNWRAPRPDGPVSWIIDGCVTELVIGDGLIWMSALSLRSSDDDLEWTGASPATLGAVA
jgi:fructan beta-fructosidase